MLGQAQLIRGNPQLNEGNVIIVKYKGKQYKRVVRWKDMGNYEGYPYIIINNRKVMIAED